MKKLLIFTIALLVPALSQAKPTPDQVKSVIDFYFNGQDQGVLLADVKLCDEIYAEGDQKNECMEIRNTTSLKKGEETNLWMMFMVPSDVDPQNIMVQFNYGGVTMSVRKTAISSSLRYRTWKKIKLDRTGEWDVKILHDKGDDLELLKEMKLTVTE